MHQPPLQIIRRLHGILQTVAQRTVQVLGCVAQILKQRMSIRDNALRGGSRSRGAFISDKIGNGDVGFMAYPADKRNAAGNDGARYHFFVECPQVFDTAAATA